MEEVLLFGGTTEGRALAEWLSARGSCAVTVSSLTEYGGSLVESLPRVRSLTGRMLPERMAQIMRSRPFACVIDATHPYAQGVSASIAASAEATSIPLVRVQREGEPEGPWVSVDSARSAARYLARTKGHVLLTTGSKDLPVYVKEIDDYKERLYVRILPVASSLTGALDLGIPASRIVAMQGPFSVEMNEALIRQFEICTIVTKASGKTGGFWEKIKAAERCGVETVVIHRPQEGEGKTLEEAKRHLEAEFGL